MCQPQQKDNKNNGVAEESAAVAADGEIDVVKNVILNGKKGLFRSAEFPRLLKVVRR